MRSLLLLVALCLSSGCGPADDSPLVVYGLEVTPPRPGMNMSAGYFEIHNNTGNTITVTHADSPQFEAVELHETTTVDGVSRMRPIDALVIAPGTTLVLERGGKHLMLMRPVEESLDTVELRLYSEDTLLLSVNTRIARD